MYYLQNRTNVYGIIIHSYDECKPKPYLYGNPHYHSIFLSSIFSIKNEKFQVDWMIYGGTSHTNLPFFGQISSNLQNDRTRFGHNSGKFRPNLFIQLPNSQECAWLWMGIWHFERFYTFLTSMRS